MLTPRHKGWRVRIVTADLCELEGDLLAVDKEGNILLQDAEEHLRGGSTRYLGVAGLRGHNVSLAEVLDRPYRKLPK